MYINTYIHIFTSPVHSGGRNSNTLIARAHLMPRSWLLNTILPILKKPGLLVTMADSRARAKKV